MTIEQEGFRWRNDDGSETSATWAAVQDTNGVSVGLNTAIRLRFVVNVSGATPGDSAYRLEARLMGSPSGAWFEVEAPGSPGGNPKIRMKASANITASGEATTAQLTVPSGSPKSFAAGRMWDDESGLDTITLGNDQYTEVEFCVEAVSANGAAANDVYEFRVTRKVAAAAGGIAEVGAGSQRADKAVTAALAPQTLAFPGNVTSGSLLVVAGTALATTDNGVISVTDTVGTSYTVVQTTGGIPGQVLWNNFIAYGIAAGSGANTVSVDDDAAGTNFYWGFAIDEFSGVHATPLDVDGGFSSGTSNSPADSITTVASGALVIGVLAEDVSSNEAITPNDGTEFGTEEDGVNFIPFSVVFSIQGSPGAVSIDWGLTGSYPWLVQTMSFKPA